MSRRRSLKAVFRWPAVIAVISIAGLLSALIGDGLLDAASWILLSVPIAVGIGKWTGGRPQPSRPRRR